MKEKVIAFSLNTLFLTTTIVVALAIGTIGLTIKVNEYTKEYQNKVVGTVIKQEVPILSATSGVVNKILVRTGDQVRAGDTMVILSNPALQSKVDILQQFTDNSSAQTEAKVGEQDLKQLVIRAPVNGTVGDITISPGSPVDNLSHILTLYSSDNISLLGQLSVDEYQSVKQLPQLQAYDERLNQTFAIAPDILNPNERTLDPTIDDKKIGLYFKFKNPKDADSLLNNEDLDLLINNQKQSFYKPIDFFVNFWNNVLHLGS